MTVEYRDAAGGGVRQTGDPEDRTFEATVCTYGQEDSYGSVWQPGVWTRSLQNKLPPSVFGHDRNRPIGRVTGYRDGPDQLDVTVKLADFDAVPDARMAHSLLKDGIIDSFSFAFVRQEDEANPAGTRGEKRIITRARMDECSPVLVGAVPGTRTLLVRDERDLVTAATSGLDRKGAAAAMMARVPHKYTPTNTDGSVCKTCGGQKDAKAHTARGAGEGGLRALAVELNSQPVDPDGFAAKLAVSTVIALLAAGTDVRSELVEGLLMSADSFLGDDDLSVDAGTRASELLAVDVPAAPDTEVADALAALTGSRHPFGLGPSTRTRGLTH